MISPFANDHESEQVGNLVIENQRDKVSIYGDIDIKRNAEGLAQVKQLHELTSRLLVALSTLEPGQQLSEAEYQAQASQKQQRISNPFLS